ncbi:MAG: sulfite exporter TauE/SafE family protein [Sphingomonadaceae bacterium]|nr:sulfite exporter TauE/SafE family protein [Sphingomonadaceae bacterium]
MDLFTTTDWALAAGILLAATLYSSVGHAGASAYIALMALFGVPAAVMRPTALALNVLVGSLASWRYVMAKQFRWRVLWPFLLGAAPMAYIGGGIHLPGEWYRPLVGVVLWIAAVRLLWPRELRTETQWRDPPVWAGIAAGAGIGLLSGLTGTGGGIFLSPILLFMAWSPVRQSSGIAAVFVLVNSVSGLAGNFASLGSLPPQLPLYAAAALLGGIAGTSLGVRLQSPWLTRALGLVLVIAGAKLVGVY